MSRCILIGSQKWEKHSLDDSLPHSDEAFCALHHRNKSLNRNIVKNIFPQKRSILCSHCYCWGSFTQQAPDDFSTGSKIGPDASFTRVRSIFSPCSHRTLNAWTPNFWNGSGGSVWTEHLKPVENSSGPCERSLRQRTVRHRSQGGVSAQLEACGENGPVLVLTEYYHLYQTKRGRFI